MKTFPTYPSHFRIFRLCLSLLLATVSLPALRASVAPLDSLLLQLDACLEESSRYVEQKEARIAEERTRLRQARSDTARYAACMSLFEEYKSYKYDSAYSYANRSLELARRLRHRGYVTEANCGIAFCLLSSGLFKEAFDIMQDTAADSIPPGSRKVYYSLCTRLHYDVADYNHEAPFQQEYVRQGSLYTDSLLALLPEKSMEWWYATGQRQMKERDYDACVYSFKTLLRRPDVDLHTDAIISSSLGWVYAIQGDMEQAMGYLIRAAMSDIRSATKETTALCVLANLLYGRGDIDRANNYIQHALADANFYNARHRKIEIGSILPIITQERLDNMKHQRNLLIGGIALFLLLFILLLTATLIIYKQMKKLHVSRRIIQERNRQLQQTNERLSEVSSIKDEYIGSSFYLNAEYIGKMENFYKLINRKIAARQWDDLRASFKESTLDKERDSMYASFDQTFLKLFPDFITAYNALFPAGEAARTPGDQTLTPEMRIFALIRLGICESERIAKFLNYSVHTINTYKTRVKNKSSVPNEQFEARIMEIAAVSGGKGTSK